MHFGNSFGIRVQIATEVICCVVIYFFLMYGYGRLFYGVFSEIYINHSWGVHISGHTIFMIASITLEFMVAMMGITNVVHGEAFSVSFRSVVGLSLMPVLFTCLFRIPFWYLVVPTIILLAFGVPIFEVKFGRHKPSNANQSDEVESQISVYLMQCTKILIGLVTVIGLVSFIESAVTYMYLEQEYYEKSRAYQEDVTDVKADDDKWEEMTDAEKLCYLNAVIWKECKYLKVVMPSVLPAHNQEIGGCYYPTDERIELYSGLADADRKDAVCGALELAYAHYEEWIVLNRLNSEFVISGNVDANEVIIELWGKEFANIYNREDVEYRDAYWVRKKAKEYARGRASVYL